LSKWGSPEQDSGREARLSLASFDVFCRRYLPVLVRFLISQARDSAWALEIAEDAMVAACDKWDDLLTFDRPDSWIFMIAIRRLRRLEARARERCLLSEGPGGADSQLAAVTDSWVSDHGDVIAAVRDLPRRHAEVVGLCYLAGYTVEDASVILGIGVGTARTHLRRGLEALSHYGSGPSGRQASGPSGRQASGPPAGIEAEQGLLR
jgi:DNA-directed RNA polymerase specialized sigma24 family protein